MIYILFIIGFITGFSLGQLYDRKKNPVKKIINLATVKEKHKAYVPGKFPSDIH